MYSCRDYGFKDISVIVDNIFTPLGQCFVSSKPVLCRPHTQTRIVLFSRVQISIPNWKPSPKPCSNRTFSNCLSHNSLAEGRPYRFRSRGTTGSSMLDHDLGRLRFGRRIQMSGHSDLGIWLRRMFPDPDLLQRVSLFHLRLECKLFTSHGSLHFLCIESPCMDF